MADRVLVLQPGVGPEPLRWESQVQDTGLPGTSQPHVISNSESSPPQYKDPPPLNGQQAPVLDAPCQTANKTGTQTHSLAERLPKVIPSSQTLQNTPPDAAQQKDKIQPHSPEHRHHSPLPGSLYKPLNQPHPLGTDTKNNGNYEPAACKKEIPNTVS